MKIKALLLLVLLTFLGAPLQAGAQETPPVATEGQDTPAAAPAPTPVPEPLEGPLLTVNVVDVGQGDAIFIQAPDGKNLLIDAGPNDSNRRLLTWLEQHGIKKLDRLLITHGHSDHVGNIKKLLLAVPVDVVLGSGHMHTNHMNLAILELMKAKAIPMKKLVAGDRFSIGEGVEVLVLAPNKDKNLARERNNNNNSVVIKVTFGEMDFLFTGDAERKVEKQMLAEYPADLACEVIKVAHHGSESSSSQAFVEAVSPQVAIVSLATKNAFGHPSLDTLDRYLKRQVKLYRTDQWGSVTVETDGKNLRVLTERAIATDTPAPKPPKRRGPRKKKTTEPVDQPLPKAS
jgi:beta-lactamase superfamily II metal-dependent hydrolase